MAQSPPIRRRAPAPTASSRPPARPRPKLAEQSLNENDEIAALEAIRVALTEVGDGVTYVWHERNGRLSGIVRPTASFKDVAGKVCRHIELIMTTDTQSGRVEGIACRLPDGRWQLDG
jgi:surface antigen